MSRALTASRISKSYESSNGPVVLTKAELAVDSGKAVAITGASGCGKSTLLHILCGLTRPDEGVVNVADISLAELKRAELGKLLNSELGFVYQFHHLLAEFTAVENVAMPVLVAGRKRGVAMQKAEQLLSDLGLGDRGDSFPSQLSGGERQRIAIARALANDPAVVIADEPTGNLDSHSASGVADMLLEACASRSCALVVATHDIDFASRFDQVFELNDGKLQSSAQ